MLPLLPIAPAIVVVVGLGAALLIAIIGISQLQATSDEAARRSADALAATLAARLGATASADGAGLLKRAVRVSSAELLLVDREGQVIVNESLREAVARRRAALGPRRRR